VGEHWKSTEGKKEKPYLKKKNWDNGIEKENISAPTTQLHSQGVRGWSLPFTGVKR
jgi:hypothetical protein